MYLDVLIEMKDLSHVHSSGCKQWSVASIYYRVGKKTVICAKMYVFTQLNGCYCILNEHNVIAWAFSVYTSAQPTQ